jgi:hypothetical protein
MGLNDLTLEKLIGEINGYKQKMQTLYEDYGHAAQELQDRINVLGYSLNEHLKDVKDSMTSTPPRLLTLETKYVSGEVNEQEYRVQKNEFKILLQRNLNTIEDIKNMITTLSLIEARPLGPAEIRAAPQFPVSTPATPSQPSTLTSRAYGPTLEDRSKPNFFAQNPTISPIQITTQVQPLPTPVQTPAIIADPSPNWQPTASLIHDHAESVPLSAPIETAESGLSLTSPQLSTPEVATPAAEAAEQPIETPTSIEETTSTPAISDALSTSVSSEVGVGTETPSATVNADPITATLGETVDIAQVEASEDVDALTVKVVDDIPTIDASSATASTETQLQPTALGGVGPGDIGASVQPTPDLAQLSPSQPTPFYKVVCPKCGADVPQPTKVWELKGGKSKKNVLIGLFQCQDCRVKFREALSREII